VAHVEHTGVAQNDIKGEGQKGIEADLVENAQGVRPHAQKGQAKKYCRSQGLYQKFLI
jgi:hypothetical protein